MAIPSKDKMKWAINQTLSMRQAAKLMGMAYNTFKKYAKMYDIWAPHSGGPVTKSAYQRGFQPVELHDILSGKNKNYSTAKLQYRLCREGYLAEECSNCGHDEYRTSDMTKPLQLDYIDDDQTNKELANLRLLCYNCYYILKDNPQAPEVPSNVKPFTEAINNAFSTDKPTE